MGFTVPDMMWIVNVSPLLSTLDVQFAVKCVHWRVKSAPVLISLVLRRKRMKSSDSPRHRIILFSSWKVTRANKSFTIKLMSNAFGKVLKGSTSYELDNIKWPTIYVISLVHTRNSPMSVMMGMYRARWTYCALLPTSSVVEHRISVGNGKLMTKTKRFVFFDVGGQKRHRAEWLSFLHDKK